jgi:hypothetical protein
MWNVSCQELLDTRGAYVDARAAPPCKPNAEVLDSAHVLPHDSDGVPPVPEVVCQNHQFFRENIALASLADMTPLEHSFQHHALLSTLSRKKSVP